MGNGTCLAVLQAYDMFIIALTGRGQVLAVRKGDSSEAH